MFLTTLFISLVLAAAAPFSDEATINWSVKSDRLENSTYRLTFSGNVESGYYTHPMDDKSAGTTVTFEFPDGVVPDGEPVEKYSPSLYKGTKVVKDKYQIIQDLNVSDTPAVIKGVIEWSSCSGDMCRMPEEWEFEISIGGQEAGGHSSSGSGSLWALIIEAILWGFAMLLTPCVFPMVPMTVSFFIKGENNKVSGKFKAAMYGLFIILLYTVPICLIIGITCILGGESVTADIFNWLSTHWLPNILFFTIFMVFAASFFGAFELTLPSSWVNGSDGKAGKNSLGGIFFLALTLVLVSFSCTGPIVGTVLIKSTQGEFWTPIVTMLAFSIAFALPFTILALFPSLLKKLPKSGGWLNSVKVVLGFIEIALGFKFLSVADQTYHWHLLDREVYLAIWIVCFSLLGLYLLGKIRFVNDSPVEYLSVKRLIAVIATFSFVVYLIPGMWGAPLKALSGYLPPIETQDFILGKYVTAPVQTPGVESESAGMLEMPHGLKGYDNIEDALTEAKATGKKVFVDITGYGCVNCREMEARVWSDPEVNSLMRDEFVMVALYNDDKTRLPEDKWITTPEGKVLKDVGRVNSFIARTRFGVNAQPNYALLDENGNLLVPVRGYDLDIDGFVEFLRSALEPVLK